MSETQTPSPETNIEPTHYAISFEDLDENTWESVLAAYSHHANGSDLEPDDDLFYMFPLDRVHPEMGLRLGSQFSPHSKLEIRTKGYTENNRPIVTFKFYLNDDLPAPQLAEADAVQKNFEADIDTLLVLTGKALPLEQ